MHRYGLLNPPPIAPPAAAGGGGGPVPSLTIGSYGLAAPQQLVSGTNTNAKGNYLNLGVLTDDIDELIIRCAGWTTNRPHQLDLRINDTTIIAADLFMYLFSGTMWEQRIPIRLPAGTKLEARTASNIANMPLTIQVKARKRSIPETITSVVNIHPIGGAPGTAGLELPCVVAGGAWSQVGAALVAPLKGIFLASFMGADTSRPVTQLVELEIGTGPDAANVTSLFGSWMIYSSGPYITDVPFVPLVKDFAAGTKFFARYQVGSVGDTVNLCLYGLA